MAEENERPEGTYKKIKKWGIEFIQCFGDENIPSMYTGCMSSLGLLLESLPSLDQKEQRESALKLNEKGSLNNWDAFLSTLKLIGYLSFIKPSQMDWRTGTWTDRVLAVICGISNFFTRAIPNYIQFIPFRLIAIGLDGVNKWLQTEPKKNPARWFIGGILRLCLWPFRQVFHRIANVIGYVTNLLNSCLMLVFNTVRFVFKWVESSMRLGPPFFGEEVLPEWGKNLYNDVSNILKNSTRLVPEIAMTLAYIYALPVAAAFDGVFHTLHLSQAVYATLNYIGHNSVMAAPFFETCLASVLVSPASQLLTIGVEGSKNWVKSSIVEKFKNERSTQQKEEFRILDDNKSSSHKVILDKLPNEEEIFALTKEEFKDFTNYKDVDELFFKINNNAKGYNRLDLVDELIWQCNFSIEAAKKDGKSSQEHRQNSINKYNRFIAGAEKVLLKLQSEHGYVYKEDTFKKQNKETALTNIIILREIDNENAVLEESSNRVVKYARQRGYNAITLIDELIRTCHRYAEATLKTSGEESDDLRKYREIIFKSEKIAEKIKAITHLNGLEKPTAEIMQEIKQHTPPETAPLLSNLNHPSAPSTSLKSDSSGTEVGSSDTSVISRASDRSSRRSEENSGTIPTTPILT